MTCLRVSHLPEWIASESRSMIVSYLVVILAVVLLLPEAAADTPKNVALEFPTFNDSMFLCTGIPSVVAYRYCWFNQSGAYVDVLPPTYNYVFPNQAGRVMYRNPISFKNSDNTLLVDFSTFFVFAVQHVPNQPVLGAGMAFLIAPELDTPDSSADGGFGLFPMDPATGLPTAGTNPSVVAVEFDTSITPNIDLLGVPHLGIDLNSLVSANSTLLGMEYLDKPVGMWIDYNNSLQTLSVYCAPVATSDATAARLKPAVPSIMLQQFSTAPYVTRNAYIGISAGVNSGGFEDNTVYYWTFHTYGFPPASLLAQWYQWWAGQSTSKKIGLVAGAVVGTIVGAYVCAECLFFCFFKRIKNPATAAEERWPVRRRTSLPGTKSAPPRRKVRDSLSVAKPLDLWTTPLDGSGEPVDPESLKGPKDDSTAKEDSDDSSTEETPLLSPLSEDSAVSEVDPDSPEDAEEDPTEQADQTSDKHDIADTAPSKRGTKPGEKTPHVVPPDTAKEKTPSSPRGTTPLAPETKAQVAKPLSPLESNKKPSESETKTEKNAAPLIGRGLTAPKESALPIATKSAPAPQGAKDQAKLPSQTRPPGQAAKAAASPGVQFKLPPDQKIAAVPQAAKPSSPVLPRPSSPGEKIVAPQSPQPSLPAQQRPLSPAQKFPVAPQAAKPSSPVLQKPSPPAAMAPQGAKPSSPTQPKPPLIGDKAVAPQAAKPSSPTQQRPPLIGDKAMAPQAAKSSSPTHPRPLPGESRATPEAVQQKAAPQAAIKPSPPARAPAAQQKVVVPQGPGSSQPVPKKDPPNAAAPRPSPQTSPKALSPPTSPKAAAPQPIPSAAPRPSPQSPQKKP